MNLQPFILFTNVEAFQFDAPLPAGMATFFKYNWSTLLEYSQSIGKFSRYPFLDIFGLGADEMAQPTELLEIGAGDLLNVQHKFVTSMLNQRCHVLTFSINPYRILPLSRVYRRDNLPNPLAAVQKYQRSLTTRKLRAIREDLLQNPDFMFPNSVLVILSGEASFNGSGTLHIPKRYGAINVVDGQHRLFAYADSMVEKRMSGHCRILVTALYFEHASHKAIERFSARTFIEINTNQTKVTTLHLEGIAHELLGKIDPRSIAAHVLRKVNERYGRIRGVLRTSDCPTGCIKVTEIVGALARITSITKIQQLINQSSSALQTQAAGYELLFTAPLSELKKPKVLIEKAVICIERYCNNLAKIFNYDFPSPEPPPKGTAFELTKMFAALVLLLQEFIEEGLNWNEVENELNAVLKNVKTLRRVKNYKAVLFKLGDSRIPNARHRIKDDFEFLSKNRKTPTGVAKIISVK